MSTAGDSKPYELNSDVLPERLAAGADGAIWLRIRQAIGSGGWTPVGAQAYVPLRTANSGPAGITLGPDGNLWFTEHAANRIGRITPLGTVTEFALPHAGGPAGIATGPDGNLYIAENSGDRIDRMSTEGRVDEFRFAECW